MAELKVKTKQRTIRGQRRVCVESDGHSKAPGFKGRGSTKRFHGCYLNPADARRKAEQLQEGIDVSPRKRVRSKQKKQNRSRRSWR